MTIHFHDSTSIATASGLGSNAGDILQTTSISRLSSDFTTSNTSVQDSGLNATITPSATSSKVIIIACMCLQAWGDQDRRAITSIHNGTVGDSTQLARAFMGEYRSGSGSSYSYGQHTWWYLDSPSTTSAITYRVGFKSGDGQDAKIQGGTGTSTRSYMYLQEVKG